MTSIVFLWRIAAGACLGLALLAPPSSRAADTIRIGSVDATSANLWPFYIAQKHGYFDAAEIKIDLVFAQSNASVIQQRAAVPHDIAPRAGLVGTSRANHK